MSVSALRRLVASASVSLKHLSRHQQLDGLALWHIVGDEIQHALPAGSVLSENNLSFGQRYRAVVCAQFVSFTGSGNDNR